MTSNFKFEKINASTDLHHLVELFQICFGDQKLNFEYLKWLYAENPDGAAIAYNAWSQQGRLVGHYAIVPRNFLPGGKFLLSVNTATHPDFGRKGIFGRLAELCYEEASARGYDGVVGVANANSIHTFTKKLGFLNLGQLKFSATTCCEVFNSPPMSLSIEQIQWRLRNPESNYRIIHGAGRHQILTMKKGVPVWIGSVELGLLDDLCKSRLDLGAFYSLIPIFAPIFFDNNKKRSKFAVPIPSTLSRSEWHLIFKNLSSDEERYLEAGSFRGLMMDTF